MAFITFCSKCKYNVIEVLRNNITPIESTNQSPMGIPVAMVEAKKREILARQANRSERDKIAATIDNTVNNIACEAVNKSNELTLAEIVLPCFANS